MVASRRCRSGLRDNRSQWLTHPHHTSVVIDKVVTNPSPGAITNSQMCSGSHHGPRRGIVSECAYARCEMSVVSWPIAQSKLPVDDQIAWAADIRRHHRYAGRHALLYHLTEGLAFARSYENVQRSHSLAECRSR